MRLLITGGHLTPALALIEEIQKRDKKKNIEFLFVGKKYALDSEKTYSLEYKEITRRNIPFKYFAGGRFTRIVSLKSLRNFFRTPYGFLNALRIVIEYRPQLIFSFGGYIALPITFWAWIFRIPIYTHEQTISPGLANKIIGFFAKKIYISFEETRLFFPQYKTVLVGNPVRSTVFSIIKKPFFIDESQKVIYITGGSLGSHSINEHIGRILEELLKSYIVIHQVGDTKEFDNVQMMQQIVSKFPKQLQKRYYMKNHFFEDELGYVYSVSDLVVSRAGANTFFELVGLKKPALFIPLPWSANSEQQKHAEIFEKAHTGEIFIQSEKSTELLHRIHHVMNNLKSYTHGFAKLSHLYKKNAASVIVGEILPEIS